MTMWLIFPLQYHCRVFVYKKKNLLNNVIVFSTISWPLLFRLMFPSLLLCDIFVTCPHY